MRSGAIGQVQHRAAEREDRAAECHQVALPDPSGHASDGIRELPSRSATGSRWVSERAEEREGAVDGLGESLFGILPACEDVGTL